MDILATYTDKEVVKDGDVYSVRYAGGCVGPKNRDDANLILKSLYKAGDIHGTKRHFFLGYANRPLTAIEISLVEGYDGIGLPQICVDRHTVTSIIWWVGIPEGLTTNQKKTYLFAKSINKPFKTRDAAKALEPDLYQRGSAYCLVGNKKIWSYSEEEIKKLEKPYEMYDFRRRAILTTSSRLSALGALLSRKVVGRHIVWSYQRSDSSSMASSDLT